MRSSTQVKVKDGVAFWTALQQQGYFLLDYTDDRYVRGVEGPGEPPAIFSPKGEFTGLYYETGQILRYENRENSLRGFSEMIGIFDFLPGNEGDLVWEITDEDWSWGYTFYSGRWVFESKREEREEE